MAEFDFGDRIAIIGGMLVPSQELRFDFKGAKFDLNASADRRLLAWVLNQFLYGEVTGIQCGHWLYHAPHLNAAQFLAKQAGEELAHVKKILRILSLLKEQPGEAHWAVKFLSTGMMGGTWGEHVAMEMALGEGLVLTAFYALVDTMPDGDIRRILESAAQEEERHVEFGERETQAWLRLHPRSRKLLLGLALIQVLALQRLKTFIVRQLVKSVGKEHPVLSQFEAFYQHALDRFALRIERLGLSRKPVHLLRGWEKFTLLAFLPLRKLRARFTDGTPLLTASYLRDPVLEQESQRQFPS